MMDYQLVLMSLDARVRPYTTPACAGSPPTPSRRQASARCNSHFRHRHANP